MKSNQFAHFAAAIAASAFLLAQTLPEPKNWDHQNMMEQLGVKALRPGPSGRAAAGEPNAANYDAAKANPYPHEELQRRVDQGRY
jgi:hypothetical protein